MAAKKKPAPAVKGKKGAAAAQSGGSNKMVVMMVLAGFVPFCLPTVVLLSITMLPTLGAWASEKGRDKYAWLCVGGLNFAGVFPFLFSLWFGVHTVEESINILSEGSVLLFSYGASAAGWLIYMSMPPMVASWLSFNTDRRVNALKAAQKKLVEEWGDEVSKRPG